MKGVILSRTRRRIWLQTQCQILRGIPLRMTDPPGKLQLSYFSLTLNVEDWRLKSKTIRASAPTVFIDLAKNYIVPRTLHYPNLRRRFAIEMLESRQLLSGAGIFSNDQDIGSPLQAGS